MSRTFKDRPYRILCNDASLYREASHKHHLWGKKGYTDYCSIHEPYDPSKKDGNGVNIRQTCYYDAAFYPHAWNRLRKKERRPAQRALRTKERNILHNLVKASERDEVFIPVGVKKFMF